LAVLARPIREANSAGDPHKGREVALPESGAADCGVSSPEMVLSIGRI